MTARLVPAATDDALGLLLDDGEADARATSAPLPERRPKLSPSASEAEGQSDVKPTLLKSPRAGAEMPVRAGVGEAESEPLMCNAWNGDRQEEGESGLVGKLTWRLWHKGEVSTAVGWGKGCLLDDLILPNTRCRWTLTGWAAGRRRGDHFLLAGISSKDGRA